MKKLIAMLLACVMVLGLVACGNTPAETTAPADNAPETTAPVAEGPEAITLKVWAPQEDQVDANSWLIQIQAQFEAAHPEYAITWDNGVCAEGDAATMVTADPAAAADVYMYANDQLGTLLQANAIARLGGDVLDQVQADNSETMVASVTSGEGVYGVPFTGNTWFMYYDKSVYTEEDIKSLDAMMAKAPVAFPVTNTWYMPAFFFANGGTMFGDGTDGTAGITFGGEAGTAATTYVANALANGTLIDDASGAGLDGLRNGTLGAIFSGQFGTIIYSAAGGKTIGIREFLKAKGIAREETMAFGDGENDMGMLEFVHIGVAMGNAEPCVKEIADHVTSSVDEGGIMNALISFDLI